MGNGADISGRVAELESRVGELERLLRAQESSEPTPALVDSGGVISFSGEIDRNGLEITYAWVRPVSHLLDASWDEGIHRLSALAHPVRGAILRRLVDGPCSVVDLVSEGVVSSSGAAYHHLNELANAGWVVKTSQGHHRIPPARLVPLLVTISASEDHR